MNSYGTPYNYNGMNYNYGNMPMQNYQPQSLQQRQMERLQALESQNNQTNSNMGQFAWVNGYVGAQAYIIPPNSMMTLFDSDADYMYVKQSDQNGKTTIQK